MGGAAGGQHLRLGWSRLFCDLGDWPCYCIRTEACAQVTLLSAAVPQGTNSSLLCVSAARKGRCGAGAGRRQCPRASAAYGAAGGAGQQLGPGGALLGWCCNAVVVGSSAASFGRPAAGELQAQRALTAPQALTQPILRRPCCPAAAPGGGGAPAAGRRQVALPAGVRPTGGGGAHH